MAGANAGFASCVVLSVLVPFETYRYLEKLFSETERTIFESVKSVLQKEQNNYYVPDGRSCFVSCTPSLHPRGKQYIVVIAGCHHAPLPALVMRLVFELRESIFTRLSWLFASKHWIPSWDVVYGIEVEEGLNVLQSAAV